jgi:geranylgeranyl diphosphate synthase type II
MEYQYWNLSGDAMLILACSILVIRTLNILEFSKVLSKTALEVCEGQQWDVDFEDHRCYYS